MARTKEFDTTKALAKAMSVFWRHGYEHTSTELLMREMGIAKQSLYDTFGDKRSLYLKALVYYRHQTNTNAGKLLRSEPSVKRGFARILFGLASETREQHERGCLLLSANMERDTADPAIAAILRENQAEVESSFVEALRRAPEPRASCLARRIPRHWPDSSWRQFKECGPWPGCNPIVVRCARSPK